MDKKESGEKFKSPLYSGGTSEMDAKDIMGKPGEPKGTKTPPNPLGYHTGEGHKD